jgi:thiol-disulfide isomerase/thioredoxin
MKTAHIFVCIIAVAVAIWLLWRYFAKNESFQPDEPGKTYLILYYMPGCPHCERMMPVWAKIEKEFAGSNVQVTKINGALDETPGITGFPTIIKISDGQTTEYSGDRSFQSLKNFAM